MKMYLRRVIASLFEYQVGRLIQRHRLKIVAVGGSVGKTSTKIAIATVLSQKYRVLVHPGNYNSEVGLPLSVFELSVPQLLINPFAWVWRLIQSEYRLRHYSYQVLVLELGTDHPGEIPHYLTYLKPDVGVITAVTPEHMENFPGGLDEVAAEELALARASYRVLANHDDITSAHRRRYLEPHPRHSYYGTALASGLSYAAQATDPQAGITLSIKRDGHVVLKGVKLAGFGSIQAKIATAAYGVGELLGLTPKQLLAGLAAINPVDGRLNPLAGAEGATIIDDTYNASPNAVVAALDSLMAITTPGRRLAILGSMNELGPDSPHYHAQVGAAAAGLDWLITLGADANGYLAPAAIQAGLDPSRCRPADSPYAAGQFVRTLLQPGDVVLVKGSQNRVFAEEAVRLLLADPADAAHLVRQTATWQTVKQGQFSDYLA